MRAFRSIPLLLVLSLPVVGCQTHPRVQFAPPQSIQAPRISLTLTDFSAVPASLRPGQSIAYSFTAPQTGDYQLLLWTEHDALAWESPVRSVGANHVMSFSWDGSTALAADAWIPEVLWSTDTEHGVWDPRETTGGGPIRVDSLLDDLTGVIAYKLPGPARVQLRAGNKYNCLFSNIVDWEVRAAGEVLDRWTGRDDTGTVSFLEDRDLRIYIGGYYFPEGTVVSSGEPPLPRANSNTRTRLPHRRTPIPGDSLAREAGRALTQLRTPPLSIEITSGLSRTTPSEPLIVVISSPQVGHPYFHRPFEISFFLDGLLIQEDPRGRIPYHGSIRLPTLKSGTYTLTTNTGNFSGQYATASALFVVPGGVS